ncbi:FMRFamide-related neuropeptides-like [Gymnodraco acuticeps]|uniref:FMRFamide-related neuropeptides-like n=1 Tax=Gymnodraco acuticeps TaxID=8218 RepID=A0A6P8UW32_GYMAC|nr:FMRFamide-related neuropeptides-like [Gymnodraco acuticeps]
MADRVGRGALRGRRNPVVQRGRGRADVQRGRGNPVVQRGRGNPVVQRGRGNPVVHRGRGRADVQRGRGNPDVHRGRGRADVQRERGNPDVHRGRGRAVRMRGGRVERGPMRTVVSDNTRATIVDHVINHGMSLSEAGQRVQPNIRRSTVASIIRIFRHENRTERAPRSGGRGKAFTPEQESAIVDMVVANNEIRLREIQARIIADQDVFSNIPSISVATIDWVLKRHHLRMKQIYKVPFERNSDRVKELTSITVMACLYF